jgi:hypothetical protein
MAKAVVDKLERSVVPGKVRLVLCTELTRDQAERLTARAIWTERTLEGLVTEILERAD